MLFFALGLGLLALSGLGSPILASQSTSAFSTDSWMVLLDEGTAEAPREESDSADGDGHGEAALEEGMDEAKRPAPGEIGEGRPRALRAVLDGVVSPGSASYLMDALAAAEDQEYDLFLLVLDTPGGLLESTREISRSFLEADVPVIVYVYPTGARAASAGMFITMSAHVAAMAPGSRIGAAAPVAMGGGGSDEESGTMDAKVVEDTAAFARSVAEQTDRNAEWAEKAVKEAVSATASEALELGVVDLLASTLNELLEQIDGREVTLHDDRRVEIRSAGAEIVDHPMTIQQRVLMVLGNPNVAYVLMMLGMLGLMMELYNPGLIFPAAIGLFLLLLAGIGLNLLPVNVGGVVLLILAIGLIVAEIYVTAYGILALAGVAIMILGSSLLMDTADPEFFVDPDITVSWGVILPTVFLMATVAIGLMLFILHVHRRRGTTGHEGMKGEFGKSRTDIGPEGGRVFVHGELWKAVSDEPIPANTSVVVVEVRGLELKVAPESTE